MRDSSAAGVSVAMERALPKDAFREFLIETRSHEDSLHFRQGEAAFGQAELALALSHHLAADLPAAGEFRNDLLAQRSRIFARLWPIADSPASDRQEGTGPARPAFAWGASLEHSHGKDRTGPVFPNGSGESADENRDWIYTAYARRSWPVAFGKREMNLGLSANAGRSSLEGTSNYETTLEAGTAQGPIGNAFFSFSAGLGMARDPGYRRYYGLQASKAWYAWDGDAAFETGYSGQWDGAWKRMTDRAWAKASRGFSLSGENTFRTSFEAAATRQESRADRYTVPVLYVADVAAAGEKALTQEAPQSFFSLSPSLDYEFALPSGLRAQAGAWYALRIYPQYAWDDIPWPDTLDPGSGALAGLALSGADGRYHPALRVEENGGYREYFGTAPVERHKSRRVDNRMGLDFKLERGLPGGYSLSAGSSFEFGWTNLAGAAPAAFRPWQWGLAFGVSRSLSG